jgi:hypothetical protein
MNEVGRDRGIVKNTDIYSSPVAFTVEYSTCISRSPSMAGLADILSAYDPSYETPSFLYLISVVTETHQPLSHLGLTLSFTDQI